MVVILTDLGHAVLPPQHITTTQVQCSPLPGAAAQCKLQISPLLYTVKKWGCLLQTGTPDTRGLLKVDPKIATKLALNSMLNVVKN